MPAGKWLRISLRSTVKTHCELKARSMAQSDQSIVSLARRRTRVKVCCIKDAAEAQLAIELGADALGMRGLHRYHLCHFLTGDRPCVCYAKRSRYESKPMVFFSRASSQYRTSGCITEDEIASIAALVPPCVSTFLLTCKPTVAEVHSQLQKCQCSTVQLVDHYPSEAYVSRDCVSALSLSLPSAR